MHIDIRHRANQRNRIHTITTFKDRDQWLELLLADDELSLGAKVVGSRIALHHNVETGQCNPKIETLVDGTRISQSSVRRHVAELETAGWLRVDRTVGRYSNSYELRVPTLSSVTGFNPVRDERVDEPNPVTGERVQDAPTLSTVTPEPCQNRPNPVNRERSRTANLRTANRTAKEIDSLQLDLGDGDSGRRDVDLISQPEDVDAAFEVFWQAYPRKVDKAKARVPYRRVIRDKKATVEQLLQGAIDYSAERSGQDPRYTKHPSSWIGAESWNNEPATGATYNAPHGRPDHIAVAEQLARQAMAKKEGGYVQ
jgi:Helix-turn-helix domain